VKVIRKYGNFRHALQLNTVKKSELTNITSEDNEFQLLFTL